MIVETYSNDKILKVQFEQHNASIDASCRYHSSTTDFITNPSSYQSETKFPRPALQIHARLKDNNSSTIKLVLFPSQEQLTCPSCKVNKKDAVLTKCFHVFCLECLKTRYETRQRKCPKCNGGFGANDYHRLYISQQGILASGRVVFYMSRVWYRRREVRLTSLTFNI